MNTMEALQNDNEALTLSSLQSAIDKGVCEFCVCTGARSSPLFFALMKDERLTKHLWFEERSAAFFALGRAKLTGKPVAIITTSGTAAGELLPATMEAYYNGVPLLLITADRPRRYRGTGAPQTAEQLDLFGVYTPTSLDLAIDEVCDLSHWDLKAPAHLNLCFDEPLNQTFENSTPFDLDRNKDFDVVNDLIFDPSVFQNWLHSVHYPFIIVGGLHLSEQKAVMEFLLSLGAPVYLEGISGLREDPALQKIRIRQSDKIWENSRNSGYPIDGVLRIGGIPTFRLWRDLEDLEGKIQVCSLSSLPFSGLSWRNLIHVDLKNLLTCFDVNKSFAEKSQIWLENDILERPQFFCRCDNEPRAEQSLIYNLSKKLPFQSRIYLGNSLPIREWDQAATDENRKYIVTASRGLNGIDGQISTFIGLSVPGEENWALLGDLTTLYDMAGPWILDQLPSTKVNIVVINNSGGKIFDRMFADQRFQHPHQLSFEPLAKMWGLKYERWEIIPNEISRTTQNRLIEIVPDNEASKRLW